MFKHTCNLSIRVVQVGGSKEQSHPYIASSKSAWDIWDLVSNSRNNIQEVTKDSEVCRK